jgi:kinesin family protein 5
MFLSHQRTLSIYTVRVSMIEIYMEKIKDLVIPTKVNLNVREDKQKGKIIEDIGTLL